jgi:sulfur-carrier protein adenylyltransferase/sulfurtransferase
MRADRAGMAREETTRMANYVNLCNKQVVSRGGFGTERVDWVVATGEEAGGPVEAGADFSYGEAFSRNLGWLTEWEQQALRAKRIAIAGMGGVGGFHLMTLVRFGIGAFNIADLDTFGLVNFNRQIGATMATLGRAKAQVMAEAARQVNPEVQIGCFDQGISEANLDQFLAGVDLCIDGLDFFVLDMRRKLNARCRELGIPVVNAAPLGMGAGYLIFLPTGMSFEEWFRLDGLTEEQQYVSYLVGMAPRALHRHYLVDPSRVDLRGHRGPSTIAGVELCAAVAGVEAVKLLLGRGGVRAAPYYHHFDAYRGRWVVRKLRGGNAHPLQRLKIAVTRRLAAKFSQIAAPPFQSPGPRNDIEKILDYARWAPSGDNSQPWRFEILDENRVIVHLTTQPDDLYDYRDGEPTLLSGGILLESMRIAASRWGRGLEWQYQGRQGSTHHIDVSLPRMPGIIADPLVSHLQLRSVDRRPYRLRHLAAAQKAILAAALGADLQIEWHEGLGQRWRLARLGAKATAIRLTTPEAFPIHQRVLDWEHQYSTTGIPAAASGISRPSLKLMRWAMRSWPRMRLINRLGGVLAATIQLDYLPGLCSAAFFTLRRTRRADTDPDRAILLLRAGQAIQRFWLTARALGLVMQPNLAPLCFAKHGIDKTGFTADRRFQNKAARFAVLAEQRMPGVSEAMIFWGRIGAPRPRQPTVRSVRRQLNELVIGAASPSEQDSPDRPRAGVAVQS